jgi:hypothetical protein
MCRVGAVRSVSKKDAKPHGVGIRNKAAPPLCAHQPRVSNFRVCHTTPENRNSKEEKGKAGFEIGKLATAVAEYFSTATSGFMLLLENVM